MIISGIILGAIAAILVASVIWWGLITLGKLLDHLEKKMKKTENTIGVADVGEVLSIELENKLEGKQKKSLQDLRKKIGEKPVMTFEYDENDKVIKDSFEFLGADARDQEMQQLLDENEGLIPLKI